MSNTQNSTDLTSVSTDETELSLHAPGNTTSKFILSQSKKPSGSTIGKSKDIPDTTDEADILSSKFDGNDNNNDTNITTNESSLELNLQLKDMRMELERRESEVKDLQV